MTTRDDPSSDDDLRKRLAEAQRELEVFEYAISHDLRAPLRGLDGFSRILLRDYSDSLDDEGKDYLERIRRASDKLRTMVEAVLTLSRLRRETLEPTTIAAAKVFENALHVHGELDPKQRVNVTVEEMTSVRTDRAMFSEIASQLISNAYKAVASTPTPTIVVGQIETASSVSRTYFVEDNGLGLSPEDLQKAKVMFKSLHTKRDFPGVGVGLALTARAVQILGGTLTAETPAEGGTRMVVAVAHVEAVEP